MPGKRSALIIASDTYRDPQLRQLRAPGRDADELAAVLRDLRIGDFEVCVSLNDRYYDVREALEEFFSERSPDDLLFLHFSCHGIKDEAGRLFLAATDTRKDDWPPRGSLLSTSMTSWNTRAHAASCCS